MGLGAGMATGVGVRTSALGWTPADFPGVTIYVIASDAASFDLTGNDVDAWRSQPPATLDWEDGRAKPVRTTQSSLDTVEFTTSAGTELLLAVGLTTIFEEGSGLICALIELIGNPSAVNSATFGAGNHIFGPGDSMLALGCKTQSGQPVYFSGINDGVVKNVEGPNANPGTREVVLFRWDGTDLYQSVNNGTEISTAAGSVSSGAANYMGRGGGIAVNAYIFALLTSKQQGTAQERSDLVDAFLAI